MTKRAHWEIYCRGSSVVAFKDARAFVAPSATLAPTPGYTPAVSVIVAPAAN